jgi:MSHA pilin protein MshA
MNRSRYILTDKTHSKGFTLIEIIIVILILAILATIAVTKITGLHQSALQASENHTLGAIREGIHIYEMQEAARGN